MRLKNWLGLFVAFNLFGCKGGPEVTVCLVDAATQSLQCSDDTGQNQITLPLEEADNFVCFSPKDTERLLKAFKKACSK